MFSINTTILLMSPSERSYDSDEALADALSKAFMRDAGLGGFIMQNVGDAQIAMGASEDLKAQMYIDAVSTVAGLLPAGKIPHIGPVIGFGVDQTLEHLVSEMKEAYASNEDEARAIAEQAARAAVGGNINLIVGSLYTAGHITLADLKELAQVYSHVTDADIDEWFGAGPPDQEKIDKDPQLKLFMFHVASEYMDVDMYELKYNNKFNSYFERPDA